MSNCSKLIVAILALLATPGAVRADAALDWKPWSPDAFAEAKATNRFVILDLEAVWCHWCHVMAETTYADPEVVRLLRSKYVTVRVDQDANPDLSNRYGNWGWPATIVFAPDGSEIVKRRGYIAPGPMASLLNAIIEDPSPGPSVDAVLDVVPAPSPFLDARTRADLAQRFTTSYDEQYGGWGSGHKFIDTDGMDLLFAYAADGDETAAHRARQALAQGLRLVDREEGGIYQYSDEITWNSPHYEKIMWYQAQGLRQYAFAYALWRDEVHRAAARDLLRYLTTVLTSPDGAFFTSQDADVDRALPGKTYYALSRAEREKFGRRPRVDTNIYARENGWAISGLVAFANATGDADALARAEKAAHWIVANRRLAGGGGFAHGSSDRGGPFLGDTLAMGQAALDLCGATGDRAWLEVAREAGDFLVRFETSGAGFATSLTQEAPDGVFADRYVSYEEQIAVARFANGLHRTLGMAEHRHVAEHAMRYLGSDAVTGRRGSFPGILLADLELGRDPTHLTIVGRKDDANARQLHSAARAYPSAYKRVDWRDRREGPMANPDVTYPELDEAAAFVCTDRICSLPLFSTEELDATVARLTADPGQRRRAVSRPVTSRP